MVPAGCVLDGCQGVLPAPMALEASGLRMRGHRRKARKSIHEAEFASTLVEAVGAVAVSRPITAGLRSSEQRPTRATLAVKQMGCPFWLDDTRAKFAAPIEELAK